MTLRPALRRTLRIDPTVPRVWRTPHSVQFGIDAPLAVLDDIGVGHERILDALTVGAGIEGLRAIGAQYGLTDREVDDVTGALSSVLGDSTPTASRRPFRVWLVGSTATAHEIARLLTSAGVAISHHAKPASTSAAHIDLGIAVGHYVLDPELHSVWLRRDIPHLPVVWGDTSVRVGPLVEPGHGPCLHCLERHRTDSDPLWPTIASQLLDRSSPFENPLTAADAAVLATRLVLDRLGGAPGRAVATTTDARGERTQQEFERHPECGCHGLAELIELPARRPRPATPGPARKGTGSGRAARAATRATTTRAGADAPA